MRGKFHFFSLFVGAMVGVLVALNFSAEANKDKAATSTLPVDELRR